MNKKLVIILISLSISHINKSKYIGTIEIDKIKIHFIKKLSDMPCKSWGCCDKKNNIYIWNDLGEKYLWTMRFFISYIIKTIGLKIQTKEGENMEKTIRDLEKILLECKKQIEYMKIRAELYKELYNSYEKKKGGE